MTDQHRTSQTPDLNVLRQQIDALDTQLVALLNQRAEVVVEVGKYKQQDGQTPIYAPDREQRVLQRICDRNDGPLSDDCLRAIWRELMSGSFALERPLRISCLGPLGSFSHLAARRQFGHSVDYHPCDSIPAVFRSVEAKEVDLGLVPVENTIGGGIHQTLDGFAQTNCTVCAEVLLPIHHHLLCQSSDLSKVTQVYSRPEVFEQCQKWLAHHLPNIDQVTVASSAKAAEMAQQDPTIAAIGSSLAAELYELTAVHQNIEDCVNNTTRFFVIGHQSSAATGNDKTALLFTTAHQAGALADVIQAFRNHDVNLTHIDKRPTRQTNWEYTFFLDCQGHLNDTNVAAAISEAQSKTLNLRVLGSFPCAKRLEEAMPPGSSPSQK